MDLPRRSTLGLWLTLLSTVGCASAVPTASPAVAVHVVNDTASVVLTQQDGILPTNDSNEGFVAPCGGVADLHPRLRGTDGGLVALFHDPSGALDGAYAQDPTILDGHGGGPNFSVDIIWSSGEMRGGEVIVIRPGGVTIETSAPTLSPGSTCAPWTYMESP